MTVAALIDPQKFGSEDRPVASPWPDTEFCDFLLT